MKNQQINKFLLMFFVGFTLFFSVSNAEFTTDVISTTISYYPNTTVTNPTYGEYSYSQIRSICNNYYKYSDNADYVETFNTMVNSLMSFGYDITVQLNGSYVFPYIYKNADLGWLPVTQYSQKYIIFTRYDNSISDIEFGLGNATNDTVSVLTDYVNQVYRASDYPTFLFSTKSIKLFDTVPKISGTLSLHWDGESYAYVSPIIPNEPDEPDVPTMSDAELANIHEILMKGNLSERFSTNKRYFIVYDFVADFYDAYFYPDVDLVYRYFDVDENYEYTNYSNSQTGYIEFSEKNSWHSFRENYTWYENIAYILNPDNYWKYQLFRKYDFNSSFSYKWTVKAADAWNEPGGLTLDLSSKKIVYTSHDIGHMIVDNSGDETIGSILDEDSIKKTDLKNPETGESYVLSDVPENSVEDVGFWENLINFIVDKIFNVADALLTIFGVNVVTLIFAIAIKAITVLVSSIALVFRFASFVLTLVAIPASSALLTVDVGSSSSGLIFTGMNWGMRFIEGLDLIKAFQWNGLGLWTLFEVFVASLEVVLFVKIVRKHYRSL